ncbi:alpha/beta-hydrolase [Trichodelitschia bisporula]|uniref:Alpha/beta-hydrolase n=1 Tax=Trichodelitschia bisporula TaxID=703511 RepID=A0A6G1HRQ8_9PEZI|nr:alpha/beta-hydrolase [Trichodelitschia bisporula]
MPSSPPPNSSIAALTILSIVVNLTRTLLALLIRAISSPFHSTGAPTYLRDVLYTALRTYLHHDSISASRLILKPTTEVYLASCRARNVPPSTLVLPRGAQAHWLGDPRAKTVLVWFHGGGYANAASPAHVKYLWSLVDALNTDGNSIAILLLAYTLAPDAAYPTQLAQAAELVYHLLVIEYRRTTDIILAGDSAGGNLVLALLSHMLHPHPGTATHYSPVGPVLDTPFIGSIDTPFRGVLLLSPWVSFNTTHGSYRRNAQRDVLDAVPLERWAEAFLGGGKSDAYSEPLTAGPEWWAGASRKVQDVLVCAGGGEVFIDGIRAWVGKFKEKFEDVRAGWEVGFFVELEAAHDIVVIDTVLGFRKRETARVVESWLRSKLG